MCVGEGMLAKVLNARVTNDFLMSSVQVQCGQLYKVTLLTSPHVSLFKTHYFEDLQLIQILYLYHIISYYIKSDPISNLKYVYLDMEHLRGKNTNMK